MNESQIVTSRRQFLIASTGVVAIAGAPTRVVASEVRLTTAHNRKGADRENRI
jgi:hypothetical protein